MLTIVYLNGCYHVRSETGFVRLNRTNVVKALRDNKLWDGSFERLSRNHLLRLWQTIAPTKE